MQYDHVLRMVKFLRKRIPSKTWVGRSEAGWYLKADNWSDVYGWSGWDRYHRRLVKWAPSIWGAQKLEGPRFTVESRWLIKTLH